MRKFFAIVLFLAISACVLVGLPSFANSPKTIVYFFWRKPKCISCVKLEKYTRESVEKNFSKELAAGEIEYRPIDFSKHKNSQYAKKYKLYTKTVILSKQQNDKELTYQKLDKIWLKINDEKDFKQYIKQETEKFLVRQ